MANVLETGMSYLQTQDPEVAACIKNEFQRQKQNIELIASENIASPAVIAAMGSVLTNKYAEGYPGKRYYGGCDYVDVLETIAIERAKKLFGAAYANVQPHSGAQANLEVYAALLQPGDTLMGMDLASGGHLTHAPASISPANTITASATAWTRRRAASTMIRSRTWFAGTGRSCLWPVRPPIPEPLILRHLPRSRTKTARCSWSTWRISRVLSQAGSI